MSYATNSPNPDPTQAEHILATCAERVLQDLDGSVRACGDCGARFTGPGPLCPGCITAHNERLALEESIALSVPPRVHSLSPEPGSEARSYRVGDVTGEEFWVWVDENGAGIIYTVRPYVRGQPQMADVVEVSTGGDYMMPDNACQAVADVTGIPICNLRLLR
jgi:hypothetical protein